MICPQCGVETPDEEWNCVSCRVNLYWAHQHYGELAHLREQQGLSANTKAPAFLLAIHTREMSNRARRGLQGDSKVREIARRVMRGEATEAP